MSQEVNPKRIIYFDFIRAFAIFGVLACHCFAGLVVLKDIFNTNLWYYSLFMNSLRDVSVPLFVTISGALLISKKDSITVFIKKRFNKVIVPYVFWVAVYLIFEIAFIHVESPFDFILKTVSVPPGGKAVFFWFVQMIIVVYIVILIINKLNEHYKITLKLSLIISVIFVFLINLNFIPVMSMPHRYIYFAIFAVFGFYLKSYDFTGNRIAKSLRVNEELLAVLFLMLSIALYLVEVYLNAVNSISLNAYTSVSQVGFLNIALVISVFLFFRYFCESKGKLNNFCNRIAGSKVGKIIFSISFCSYGMYLTHIMIMESFLALGLSDYLSPSIHVTIKFFATFIGSWLLTLAISKIPYLKKVSGV